LQSKDSVLKFPGWMILYNAPKNGRNGQHLDSGKFKIGSILSFISLNVLDKQTPPPPYYNEASLIKELEKFGIGRPSTYAPIMSTIQDRGYVQKQEGKLKATDVGKVVTRLLNDSFKQIMDVNFTAGIEESLDGIANGEKERASVIKDFYVPSEYERAVNIPDQIEILSKKVIEILDKTNQYGKTIIFCVDMAHAQAVKDKLNELKSSEEYASRVVSEDKDDLTRFRDKERVMPVVATTVDLLSTGVDIPHLENIIFMRPIASRVLFKQIIGRGSRLFEGKGFFRIIDFTNATRLIDEWDIPTEKPEPPELPEEPIAPYDKLVMGIVVDNKMESPITGAIVKAKLGRWEKLGKTDENGVFKLFGLPSNDKISISIEHAEYKKLNKKLKPHTTENETPYEFRLKAWKSAPKKITIKGIVVTIDEEVEVEFDGIKLSYAEYRKYSKDKISQTIHSSDELRVIWLDPEKRERFIADLEAMKVNITLIKSIENLEDIDSFDVVAHIAFDAPLMTREDRVKHFMRHNAKDIDRYGKEIGEAIREIMEKYKNSGEENLSAQAFLLPNMNAKKEAIQAKYPEGLYGFIHTLKQKVYSFAG
ncbi:MAG: Type I site-specific deoxyribonuclease, partial [Microgenomates group bacterium GW2011_GWC1_39_12]